MNPTLEQLARYVAQELGRGVPEVTLYASLREAGWTQEWITGAFSTAKQRAVPDSPGQMNFPHVQKPVSNRPAFTGTPALPLVQPAAKPASSPVQKRSLNRLKKTLLWVIAGLSVVVIGLTIYRTINAIQHQAEQRVARDAVRREDLSVLLSNLSDYYLTHHSYPTRTQLNTASFLQKNGFSQDSITDPRWSNGNDSCTKDGKPILAGNVTPGCYAYGVTTDAKGICNNGSAACSKVTVTIWLEVDKKPYSVVFDKNTQAN